MKTILVTLCSLSIALASSAAFVACSSDDSNANPGPTPLDGSSGTDTGGGNVDSGSDTGGGNGDSSTDAPTDAPPCTTDAATCNSCVTPQQDPLHACSPATANCIPFDNTRVPANVPQPQ